MDLTFRRLLSALIVVAFSGLAAQTGPRPGSTTAPSASTDRELEKAIRERFARSKCAADNFTVRVQGGVAVIEGKTGVVQRKGAATRMAKTAGAKKVINKIEVSEAARQKAADGLTKGRRRAQVKRSEAERR